MRGDERGDAKDADTQLLIETAIESGMRWGELTEVRVRDLDFETCILTVSRAVVELTPGEHADGARFLVKDYPKDKEYRRLQPNHHLRSQIPVPLTPQRLAARDLLLP